MPSGAVDVTIDDQQRNDILTFEERFQQYLAYLRAHGGHVSNGVAVVAGALTVWLCLVFLAVVVHAALLTPDGAQVLS